MRATAHAGRLKSAARHNNRAFNVDLAEHIDKVKMTNNAYWCCYDGMEFSKAENKYYNEHFKELMTEINERAKKSYHPERMTNASKLIASKKTMPEEIIFQIGNRDAAASASQLKAVFNDFFEWQQKKFGSHIKPLDIAIHVDEATPHIHMRQVWTYKTECGYMAIGQHKALEQMGYQLPDKDKPRGKNNNLKQVYTAEVRQKWLEICKEHGFAIEHEPENKSVSEQNLKKNEYILSELQRKQASLVLANDAMENTLDEKVKAVREALTKFDRILSETKQYNFTSDDLEIIRKAAEKEKKSFFSSEKIVKLDYKLFCKLFQVAKQADTYRAKLLTLENQINQNAVPAGISLEEHQKVLNRIKRAENTASAARKSARKAESELFALQRVVEKVSPGIMKKVKEFKILQAVQRQKNLQIGIEKTRE